MEKKIEPKNIGFISTRFAGTDGVSLETKKWVDILEELGHKCFYFAGLCDRPDEISLVSKKAFYRDPEVLEKHSHFFGTSMRSKEDTKWIHDERKSLKKDLHQFITKFSLDMLVPENCLTIPIQIPLGLALTEVIAETGIATIAHHHDFVWERKRFLVNAVSDYIDMAFPPNLPSIQHVVINSIAQNDLASRCGIASTVVPNVMDFSKCEVALDDKSQSLREKLGIAQNELFILQPTRIVQRKGIEHAIELVSRLNRKAHLVISHASGDEGDSYAARIMDYASHMKVNLIFASDLIGEGNEDKPFTLGDAYRSCDLVSYPSEYEGFGNAFLEGIYFNKPIVVQNYTVYSTDIRPLGFDMIEFDNYITDKTLEKVRKILDNKEARDKMVSKNFELAKKYFSYSKLRYKIKTLTANAFGPDKSLKP